VKFDLDQSEELFMVIRKVGLAVLLAFSITAFAADRKYIPHPQPADAKPLPFSDAVLVGNTLYIAGHIGTDPKTGMAPADAEEEAHLVMDGIKKTVESAGLSMDDVVTIQVFCTDLKYYDTFNAVYKTYFHDNYPARAFVGTDKLLRNGKYEVLGIAVKR
jgi:2-iminobutanoate/2-iminopropanoate deaminase